MICCNVSLGMVDEVSLSVWAQFSIVAQFDPLHVFFPQNFNINRASKEQTTNLSPNLKRQKLVSMGRQRPFHEVVRISIKAATPVTRSISVG